MATKTENISIIVSSTGAVNEEQRQANLERIFDKVTDPPALSTVGTQLIQELRSPATSAKSLTQIISGDPVIAAKILRHANSSFYGTRNKIRTLHNAIVMLGTDAIKQIALTLVFCSWTQGKGSGDLHQRFLNRSLATAVLSRKLCEYFCFQTVGPGEAYLAGLLHNIGIYLLYRFHRQKFVEALKIASDEKIPLFEAEERVFGCNHADVGSWQAEKWRLPQPIQEVTRNHHRCQENIVNRELLALVQLADGICSEMGLSISEEKDPVSLCPSTIEILEKKQEGKDVQAIFEEVLQRFGGVCFAVKNLLDSFEEPAEEKKNEQPEKEQVCEEKLLHGAKPPRPKTQFTKEVSPLVGFVVCGIDQMLRGKMLKGGILFTTCWLGIVLFALFAGLDFPVASMFLCISLAAWGWNVLDLIRTSRTPVSSSES